jgi:hypothetical protein
MSIEYSLFKNVLSVSTYGKRIITGINLYTNY